MNKVESLVILGTGPAGLTAAIFAARANLSPLCIEGTQPGGQLTITTDVENYPGFSKGVMGPTLMEEFRLQALRFGTRFIQAQVVAVDLSQRPFELKISNGESIFAQALIVATGASAKWLGLENEKRLLGKGVSGCATCDGFFFRCQKIVVVGGADTCLEEANFLTRFASSVTIVHRRDHFRASKAMQTKVFSNPKIKILWDSVVSDILGKDSVEGVLLKNIKNDKDEKLDCSGVFVAIGHQCNSGLFKGQLDLDANGYIKTNNGSTKTSVEGVFAAGDVSDSVYRQAITACGTGCMAAIDAERFLGHS